MIKSGKQWNDIPWISGALLMRTQLILDQNNGGIPGERFPLEMGNLKIQNFK